MKKLLFFISVLVISGLAFSQLDNTDGKPEKKKPCCEKFVDVNNDKVCDNFKDLNNYGKCDECKTGCTGACGQKACPSAETCPPSHCKGKT